MSLAVDNPVVNSPFEGRRLDVLPLMQREP